jgi:hypothetical protein
VRTKCLKWLTSVSGVAFWSSLLLLHATSLPLSLTLSLPLTLPLSLLSSHCPSLLQKALEGASLSHTLFLAFFLSLPPPGTKRKIPNRVLVERGVLRRREQSTHTHTHTDTAPPTPPSTNFIRYSFKKHTCQLAGCPHYTHTERGRQRGGEGVIENEKGKVTY